MTNAEIETVFYTTLYEKLTGHAPIPYDSKGKQLVLEIVKEIEGMFSAEENYEIEIHFKAPVEPDDSRSGS